MNYRRTIISLFTFLGGIYFFLEFVLPEKLPEFLGGYEFGLYHTEISNGFIAVGAVAFALGLINLFYVHGAKIVFVRKGAINSVALLVSLLLMGYLTLNEWISSEITSARSSKLRNLALFAERIKIDAPSDLSKSPQIRGGLLLNEIDTVVNDVRATLADKQEGIAPFLYQDLAQKLSDFEKNTSELDDAVSESKFKEDYSNFTDIASALNALAASLQKVDVALYKKSSAKLTYDFVYEGFFVPLGSAMFSLLGFYIISAGYRAFRVRSVESGLMMAAAVVVMLGQIPFYIYISDALPEIRLWLLEVPSSAAFRAVKFGAAVAGLYMAIRMWFSIETASFVDSEEASKS